jgi:hypothetical protein
MTIPMRTRAIESLCQFLDSRPGLLVVAMIVALSIVAFAKLRRTAGAERAFLGATAAGLLCVPLVLYAVVIPLVDMRRV